MIRSIPAVSLSAAFLLIGTMTLFLSSCTGAPKKYLASQAVMIKKGQDPASVAQLIGPPDARQPGPNGSQRWYYYQKNSHIYNKIPWIGKHLGHQWVDALEIIFVKDRVFKITYYVPKG